MSLEEIKFTALTVLSGFLVGFLTAFLGIKISKILLVVGIILLAVFYFYVNSDYNFGWLNFKEIFADKMALYTGKIDDMKSMILKNVPLTIGIIIGVIYGIKKGL